MTSARKAWTNRMNGRSSTGPKSRAGRATAARNALRHGLRVPVLSDPVLTAEVEVMARKIAGGASPGLVDLARRIAEAEIDVLRVRRARSDFISHELLTERTHTPRGWIKERRNEVAVLLRIYKALLREKPPRPVWDEELEDVLENVLLKSDEEVPVAKLPHHYGSRLEIIDRYERRALSRRKFAIRAFDEARCRSHGPADHQGGDADAELLGRPANARRLPSVEPIEERMGSS